MSFMNTYDGNGIMPYVFGCCLFSSLTHATMQKLMPIPHCTLTISYHLAWYLATALYTSPHLASLMLHLRILSPQPFTHPKDHKPLFLHSLHTLHLQIGVVYQLFSELYYIILPMLVVLHIVQTKSRSSKLSHVSCVYTVLTKSGERPGIPVDFGIMSHSRQQNPTTHVINLSQRGFLTSVWYRTSVSSLAGTQRTNSGL